MKNRFRTLIGLVSVAMFIFVATLSGVANAQDKGTVISLIPTLLDEFQTESQSAVETVFPQLGYKVTSLDAQNRADLQLNQFDDAIELKPAAIILNAVDFGMTAQQAVAAPRFCTTSDNIDITNRILRRTVRALTEMGYPVRRSHLSYHFAGVHALRRTAAGWDGGADPGRDGMALAV